MAALNALLRRQAWILAPEVSSPNDAPHLHGYGGYRLTLPKGRPENGKDREARGVNLVPIGRFSKMTGPSVKALRLYDENGLLPPAFLPPRLSQVNPTPQQRCREV